MYFSKKKVVLFYKKTLIIIKNSKVALVCQVSNALNPHLQAASALQWLIDMLLQIAMCKHINIYENWSEIWKKLTLFVPALTPKSQ